MENKMTYQVDDQFFSDLYKDCYGFRPRGIVPTEEHIEYLLDYLERELKEERIRKDSEIKFYMNYGASDVDTAKRWIKQAYEGK